MTIIVKRLLVVGELKICFDLLADCTLSFADNYFSSINQMVEPDIYEANIKRQDYEKLKLECLQKQVLFTDHLFSIEKYGSYFNKGNFSDKKIEWLRPTQIVENPYFFKGGMDRFDVNQGSLSDCWFLSAVSNLTMTPKLLKRVVPKQTYKVDYAGIFYFHFYQYGKWITVVIDDVMPTYKGQLILGHSKQHNEFWLALLEKAYAKLKGGYEALNYGQSCEALVDFTGGVTECFQLPDQPSSSQLFSLLFRYELRNTLVVVYISRPGQVEEKLPNGLVIRHTYSITGLRRIRLHGQLINLIRLRNPWGEGEWNGPWSDHSPMWNHINHEYRKRIGLNVSNDGEFWMNFDDFLKNFNVFECCHSIDSTPGYYWSYFEFFGEWDSSNCGGCVHNRETFPSNPQYLFNLAENDMEEDDELSTVLISLTQKHYRYRKAMKGEDFLIGFIIYLFAELDDKALKKGTTIQRINSSKRVEHNYFRGHLSIARSNYIAKQQNCGRFRLKQSQYLIIPTTFKNNEKASFMLQVLVSKSKEDKQSFRKKMAIQEVAGHDKTGFFKQTSAGNNHNKSPGQSPKKSPKRSPNKSPNKSPNRSPRKSPKLPNRSPKRSPNKNKSVKQGKSLKLQKSKQIVHVRK